MKKLTLMLSVLLLAACSTEDNEISTTLESNETTPTAIIVPAEQWANQALFAEVEKTIAEKLISGIRLNFQMEGVTHVVLESVDNCHIAGVGNLQTENGKTTIAEITEGKTIITYRAPEGSTLQAGKDYVVTTFPCDLQGGYRLSIYKDGKVAHYFGVHQVTEAGKYIAPLDLDESELEFDDPDAPLVEEERPELDKKTKELLRIYKKNPTDENYQALYDQMGVRYDKVVARKKAKLRELEREAHHQSLIDEMQGIVDEMVTNREERLWQRFLSLIDSRTDDDTTDEWLVLKGAWQENAYTATRPSPTHSTRPSSPTTPTRKDKTAIPW